MGRPDALSREAGHERGENDNQDVVLLKPELFRVLLRATALDFEGEDESLVRRVKDCTAEREESVVKALLLKNPRWKEHPDGLLTHDDCIYLPRTRTYERISSRPITIRPSQAIPDVTRRKNSSHARTGGQAFVETLSNT